MIFYYLNSELTKSQHGSSWLQNKGRFDSGCLVGGYRRRARGCVANY